ncbi:hypothetical protein N7462_006047 [Penicillium macrosclerotiorum]|uniref:uncharacterized protein n=1 Tax=Penicillium macrosclerotiorum TaxID=303699 RepID=UPI002548CC6E|nr:uncharacterized protein N7462_006047 [Penicillium macrosclerotiorum]KAJ5682882.1 hypothetical protein N7462_006047 [Penicillium macrosclerotiorum]
MVSLRRYPAAVTVAQGACRVDDLMSTAAGLERGFPNGLLANPGSRGASVRTDSIRELDDSSKLKRLGQFAETQL